MKGCSPPPNAAVLARSQHLCRGTGEAPRPDMPAKLAPGYYPVAPGNLSG